LDSDTRDEIYATFYDRVNMQPKELEKWLETEESRSVGDSEEGESTGHRSGRRIVEIKRTNKDELSESQFQHMNKVSNYISRHLAQRPDGGVEESDWRYSLMNWGHDPMKDD
jgi:hypothetical protein